MAAASVASSSLTCTWSSSGYASSSMSEEDLVMSGEEKEGEGEEERRPSLYPGICPHCKHIYNKPVTLQCGHSLCTSCCHDLLSQLQTRCLSRSRIRMGIASLSYSSLNKSLSSSSSHLSRYSTPIQSPRCIVCGEPPKKSPPVPNHDLDAFLRTVQLPKKLRDMLKDGKRVEEEDDSWREDSMVGEKSDPITILDCNIAIVGGRGVGKTSLQQAQLGNDMFVEELLGMERVDDGRTCSSPQSSVSEDSCRDERRGVRYMLKLLDDGHPMSEKLSLSMGVIVMYSISDRESFIDASHLLSMFQYARGKEVPIVLVGSKSDLDKRRVVQSYEGQQLAKQHNSPFLEVSARKNDCVNEAFCELVRLMKVRKALILD